MKMLNKYKRKHLCVLRVRLCVVKKDAGSHRPLTFTTLPLKS
jgi:hypothetical protein